MEPALVCVDLDGTLTNPDKAVTKACRQALADAVDAGLTVAFASGRDAKGIFSLMDEMGLPHTCAALSGAISYLDGREVGHHTIEAGRVLEVVRVAERLGAYVGVSGADFWLPAGRIRWHPAFAKGRDPEEYTPYEDLYAALPVHGDGFLKVSLHTDTGEEFENLREALSRIDGIVLARSDANWLDVTAEGCTKAEGIGHLRQAIGLSPERVAMVGDDENDVAALRAAGLAIAMGNAAPSVKAVADVVVADNAHDGCAEALHLAIEKFTND